MKLSDVPMNTYDPVVQCPTARLMLVITCIMVLKTQWTNIRNEFYQAELNQLVYLQTTSKYSNASWVENPILRLKKSLYGQAEAPRLWYKKLKDCLEKCGFTPSKVDPCISISKTVICVQ